MDSKASIYISQEYQLMRNQLLFRCSNPFKVIGSGINTGTQGFLAEESSRDTSGFPFSVPHTYRWMLSSYREDPGFESFGNIAAYSLLKKHGRLILQK